MLRVQQALAALGLLGQVAGPEEPLPAAFCLSTLEEVQVLLVLQILLQSFCMYPAPHPPAVLLQGAARRRLLCTPCVLAALAGPHKQPLAGR
jgi:hypothetical protein